MRRRDSVAAEAWMASVIIREMAEAAVDTVLRDVFDGLEKRKFSPRIIERDSVRTID